MGEGWYSYGRGVVLLWERGCIAMGEGWYSYGRGVV